MSDLEFMAHREEIERLTRDRDRLRVRLLEAQSLIREMAQWACRDVRASKARLDAALKEPQP